MDRIPELQGEIEPSAWIAASLAGSDPLVARRGKRLFSVWGLSSVRSPMSRQVSVFFGSAVPVVVVAFAGAATAGFPIMPHQQFGGLVNGRGANATVALACFGASRPGHKGHPMGGQTLEVIQGPYGGDTGSRGTSIVARFREDPSEVVVQAAQPMPTSLLLPCAGSGLVVFSPEPDSPTAKAATVTVNYVGQP